MAYGSTSTTNLGRRLSSVQKEHHQEESNNDFAFCQRLASQISTVQELPTVCRGFQSQFPSTSLGVDTAATSQSSSETIINPIHVPRGMARSRIYRRRDTTPSNPIHVPRGVAFARLFRPESPPTNTW